MLTGSKISAQHLANIDTTVYRKICLAFETIGPNHTYLSFFFYSPEKRERETSAHTTLTFSFLVIIK